MTREIRLETMMKSDPSILIETRYASDPLTHDQNHRRRVTEDQLVELGYQLPRQLPDGRWIALCQMAYTVGLFVDLDEIGYADRYCYEHGSEAIRDLYGWDGEDDPPGMWIKRKGRQEYLNPRWAKDDT